MLAVFLDCGGAPYDPQRRQAELEKIRDAMTDAGKSELRRFLEWYETERMGDRKNKSTSFNNLVRKVFGWPLKL